MTEPPVVPPLVFALGREELTVRRRYEVLSVLNDILIALWFIVGSVLFFSPSTTTAGTWLFLIGSVELLLRPVIRLTRNVHVSRLPSARHGLPVESTSDF